MVFTGADLIRTSGQVLDRAERFKVRPDAVAAVAAVAPQEQGASLSSEDSQNALLRFARFVTDEKKKQDSKERRKPLGAPQKGPSIPSTYVQQMALGAPESLGQTLDIRV